MSVDVYCACNCCALMRRSRYLTSKKCIEIDRVGGRKQVERGTRRKEGIGVGKEEESE